MSRTPRFRFAVEKQAGLARAGRFVTPHGTVQTPVFMPVGTLATIKALDTADIFSTHAQIILGNTYHLYLRPGEHVLNELGGVHSFMQWDKPLLTDSGGFQVFSLGSARAAKGESHIAHVTDEGVRFRSHLDGSAHFFTPERSIEMQRTIGADIVMAFDEALSDAAPEEYAVQSLERTSRWAERCVSYWEHHNRMSIQGSYQALFGIVQGGLFPHLRQKAAEHITSLPFDGIAVGGETIGYNMPATVAIMEQLAEVLPMGKPRYAMGLGRDPQDLIDAFWAGVDMCDCVGPTRLARNGALYVGELQYGHGEKPQFVSPFPKARLNIGKAEWATDTRVIDDHCDCYTCTAGYTRAYLHHLYGAGELTYYRLASIHNVRVMVRLSEEIRKLILEKI